MKIATYRQPFPALLPKPQHPAPPSAAQPAEPPAASEAVQMQWSKMQENPNFRPARLQNIAADGTWHIQGVRWGFDEMGNDSSKWVSRFKDIKVKPSDIKEVYIGLEPFAPELVAGHGHAVLEFNQPLTNSDGEQDTRMVVSLEAWTAPGESYGLAKGMKKNFGVIYQLGSFSDRVQRQTRKEGRSIKLYHLNLTQDQKQAFVETSLREAVQDRTGEYYNTLTNSCFGAQVANLNQVLPEKNQIHRWTELLRMPKMSATLPASAGLVLERYHLRSLEDPIEILPDARLHPQAKALQEPGLVAQLSQKSWWGTASRLTGAAAGMALGASLAGTPGALLGSVALSYAGGIVGDHLRILNGSRKIQPDEFFPQHIKDQLKK